MGGRSMVKKNGGEISKKEKEGFKAQLAGILERSVSVSSGGLPARGYATGAKLTATAESCRRQRGHFPTVKPRRFDPPPVGALERI